MNSKVRTLVAMALLAGATVASAAVVSFAGSEQGTNFGISFDDNTAGRINVVVTSTASPNQADLFGLGFDWAGNPVPSNPSSFTFVSSNTGEGITGICGDGVTPVDACGGGLNFNGTGESFDFIVRMGDSGTQGGNYLTYFNFYISSALSLNEMLGEGFGIRAQSTGANGQGSIKLVDFDRVPTAVPEPAMLALLGLGLVGVAAARRRKL